MSCGRLSRPRRRSELQRPCLKANFVSLPIALVFLAVALLGMTSHMEFVGGSEIDPVKRTCMQVVHKNFQMPTNKRLGGEGHF